jgi:chaperonin GroES
MTDAADRPSPKRAQKATPQNVNKRTTKSAAKKTTSKARRPRADRTPDGQLRLTGDRLVVRTPENGERTSSGGLLIPATAMPAPRRLMWADVALVGPEVRVAKLGDRVLFLPQAGLEVELDGEEVLLLRERDVQAVQAPGGGKDRPPGQYL